jgi:hypothetical protein
MVANRWADKYGRNGKGIFSSLPISIIIIINVPFLIGFNTCCQTGCAQLKPPEEIRFSGEWLFHTEGEVKTRLKATFVFIAPNRLIRRVYVGFGQETAYTAIPTDVGGISDFDFGGRRG